MATLESKKGQRSTFVFWLFFLLTAVVYAVLGYGIWNRDAQVVENWPLLIGLVAAGVFFSAFSLAIRAQRNKNVVDRPGADIVLFLLGMASAETVFLLGLIYLFVTNDIRGLIGFGIVAVILMLIGNPFTRNQFIEPGDSRLNYE